MKWPTCSKCGASKEPDQMSSGRGICKACHAAWARENYAKKKASIADLVGTKDCVTCGQTKDVNDFPPASNKCKVCKRTYHQQWASATAEHLRARREARYAANREAELASAKQWAIDNRERSNAIKKRWAERNQDYMKARYARLKAAAPDSVRRKGRESVKRASDELHDHLVRTRLAKAAGVPRELITDEMVNVKRKHTQILRKLKEYKDEE